MPQRPSQRVMLERCLNRFVLDVCSQLSQRASRGNTEVFDAFRNSISLRRTDRLAVQPAQSLDPTDRPNAIRVGIDVPERAERQIRSGTAKIVELSADRSGENVERIATVEGKDLGSGVAEPLRRKQAQKCRFAGTGRPANHSVTEIADMQIESKWRGAAGGCI